MSHGTGLTVIVKMTHGTALTVIVKMTLCSYIVFF